MLGNPPVSKIQKVTVFHRNMDDLVIDKNLLKIHGYISNSDEDSEDESKTNLDDIYEAFKPSPIHINPKIHKIIEVGCENKVESVSTQHSSYSSALKHNLALKNEAQVSVETAASGQKLSKGQLKRIKKKMKKSVSESNSKEFSCDNTCDNEENIKRKDAFSANQPSKRRRKKSNKSTTALKNGCENIQEHVKSYRKSEAVTLKEKKCIKSTQEPRSMMENKESFLNFHTEAHDTKESTLKEQKKIESNKFSEDLADTTISSLQNKVKNCERAKLSQGQRRRRNKALKKAAREATLSHHVTKKEIERDHHSTEGGNSVQAIKHTKNKNDHHLVPPHLSTHGLTVEGLEEISEFMEMLENYLNTRSYSCCVRIHSPITNWIEYWCPGTGVCML